MVVGDNYDFASIAKDVQDGTAAAKCIYNYSTTAGNCNNGSVIAGNVYNFVAKAGGAPAITDYSHNDIVKDIQYKVDDYCIYQIKPFFYSFCYQCFQSIF